MAKHDLEVRLVMDHLLRPAPCDGIMVGLTVLVEQMTKHERH